MKTNIGKYCEGTSAIRMPSSRTQDCRIISSDFPKRHSAVRKDRINGSVANPARHRSIQNKSRLKRMIHDAADSSEMFCSFMHEDVRGCAYDLFSSSEVIGASAIISVITILAAIVGA